MDNKLVINKNAVVVDLTIIILGFCIGIFIVNPIGNFPLNDDWSFATTVKRLVDIGIYVPNGWAAMTQLTNIGWGALFCLPFGFSFNALRASTFVASIFGIIGVYLCARELRLSRVCRIIASLTLAFNPIYFALSNTFMTDVLFSSLQTISALFFLRCLKYDESLSLFAGIVTAIAATMSRQLGMAVPIAFFIVYILLHGVNFRAIVRGLLPLLFCIGALVLYQHWLSTTGRITVQFSGQNEKIFTALRHPGNLILSETINAYVAALYFGLFLLPALLLFAPAARQQHVRKNINIWLVAILVGAATYIFSRFFGEPRLPMLGNILARFGIGPLTLKDTYILGLSAPELPRKFWLMLTWIAIVGMALILSAFMLLINRLIFDTRRRKITTENSSVLFFVLSAIVYLFAIFTSNVFDRYLVPAIALLMLGILGLIADEKFEFDSVFRCVGIVATLGFSIFSICTTRDYIEWNRVRWQALNDLTQVQKVSRNEIDGGFEFNGFYLYDRNYRPRIDKSWWWVEDDTYLVSFHNVFGYDTIKAYPYYHWLPSYRGKILVLKKSEF